MASAFGSTSASFGVSLLVVSCLVGCNARTGSGEAQASSRGSASVPEGEEPEENDVEPGHVEEPHVKGKLDAPISLNFRRQNIDQPSGDFNPEELGGLMHESVVVVYGQVKRVDGQSVQFDVIEILKGKLEDKDLKVPENPADYPSCVSTELKWRMDEKCVLFLVRDARGEGLQVLYNRAGKQPVPVQGMFTVDDLRRMLNGEMFTEERALELARKFGPGGILYEPRPKLPQNARVLHGEKLQKAFLHFFQNLDQRGELTVWQVEPLIHYLAPETAKADKSLVNQVRRALYDELPPQAVKERIEAWLERVDSQ